MTKLLLLTAAASAAALSSCYPPPSPPPPRFQPNAPYPPQQVAPNDNPYGVQQQPSGYDVSPPPVRQPSQPLSATGGHPTATATANPDQVISPYEPYNVIDISGPPRIESGKLARDPSNNKIFRVP